MKSLTIALAQLYADREIFSRPRVCWRRGSMLTRQNIAHRHGHGAAILGNGPRAGCQETVCATSSHGEPNDVAALLGLAQIATAARNWPEATDYISRAHTAEPNDPAPGIALVNLELLRQDWKNAVATAAQIAEQFPTNFDVLDAKARAQIAAGDSEGRLATYKLLYGLFPNSIPAMRAYVARLKEAKEFAKAQTVLQAALARDPKNDQVKGRLDTS